MVVSLSTPVQSRGARRLRLFQSATDDRGYRLLPDGQLRWDRFLARLRTRIALPPGWSVTSVDHPARIGRDDQGRQTLDFLHPSGDSPKLVLIAHPVKQVMAQFRGHTLAGVRASAFVFRFCDEGRVHCSSGRKTVPSETLTPSVHSSPCIRGAPRARGGSRHLSNEGRGSAD